VKKKKNPKFTQAEACWFQEQAALHREEIRALRALIVNVADELAPGGLAGRLLATELRRRLAQLVKAT
jgi:diphthamide synthase (EF-2-diphthine--ammonia ligase)